MTTTALKKKIQDCINSIENNEVLEAVYTILNKHVLLNDFELSSADLKIIEERKKSIKNAGEKTYSVADVKKKILKNLGK